MARARATASLAQQVAPTHAQTHSSAGLSGSAGVRGRADMNGETVAFAGHRRGIALTGRPQTLCVILAHAVLQGCAGPRALQSACKACFASWLSCSTMQHVKSSSRSKDLTHIICMGHTYWQASAT